MPALRDRVSRGRRREPGATELQGPARHSAGGAFLLHGVYMAKSILKFFGGASILVGLLIIGLGFDRRDGGSAFVALLAGSGFLVAGAPLLGFARVIELLEQIAANTGSIPTPRSRMPQGAGGLSAFAPVPSAVAPPAPASEPPRPGRHTVAEIARQDIYRGRPFDVHADGAVISAFAGQPATWRSEVDFKEWADQQPAVG